MYLCRFYVLLSLLTTKKMTKKRRSFLIYIEIYTIYKVRTGHITLLYSLHLCCLRFYETLQCSARFSLYASQCEAHTQPVYLNEFAGFYDLTKKLENVLHFCKAVEIPYKNLNVNDRMKYIK